MITAKSNEKLRDDRTQDYFQNIVDTARERLIVLEHAYTLTRELFSLLKVGKYGFDWASCYEKGLERARRGEHRLRLTDYNLRGRCGLQLVSGAPRGLAANCAMYA